VRGRSWIVAVLCAAACDGDSPKAAADRLEGKVAELERRLAASEAQQQRLLGELRQHGITVHAEPPANDAEAVARTVEELEAALGRLDGAKENRDTVQGQSAMDAIDAALQRLRAQGPPALRALLAAAEAAPTARQPALLECYGRIGGVAAVPELLAIAGGATRPPALRLQAARSLIEADPVAAIPTVRSLLQEDKPLPELYLLVHLLAATARPEVVPLLATALHDCRDRSVRCHAATGLGNFKDEAAAAALAAAAIGDEYPAVRSNALRALARAADAARVRETAAAVLAKDTDPAVRAVAKEVAPAAGR
jgi:HEAT repeat protein